MAINIFFEEILKSFQKKEKAKTPLQQKVLDEITRLVKSMTKAYEVSNNTMLLLFESLKEYLPENTNPEELRILCNLFYMSQLIGFNGEYIFSKKDPIPYVKKSRIKDWDAWKKGFQDWKKLGPNIVGPGEAIFFSRE